MNLAAIITRLDTQVTALKKVGGAAEVEAALKALSAAPAAFVIEQTDEAGENNLAGDVHQRVDVDLLVLLAVPNAKDSRGEAGQTDLETLRAATRTALLGWSPTSDIEPLTYKGGQLFRFDPGLIWWLDAWRTAHYIRSAV